MESLSVESHPWIPGFCREFSVATGWPVEFSLVDPSESRAARSRYLSDTECCWFTELKSADDTVGFLHINLPDDPGVDHSFVAVCDLATLFSNLIGRALTATESLETVNRDLSTWVDVGLASPAEDELLTTLNGLLQAATQLTGFRSTAFFLLNPNSDSLLLRATHGIELADVPRQERHFSEAFADLQAHRGDPVLASSKTLEDGANWLPKGHAIGYCAAVRSDSLPLGTLWAFDRRERIPTDRECHVLQSLAARIANVLERVVLLQESEIQHRQQHDLNIASQSQRLDILGGLSSDVGFDAAALCTSRFELGGDLCELIPLDEHRTIVAVGDASGDSVPAAMVMSMVRGALGVLSRSDNRPLGTATVMRQINHTLHGITPSHQFMSLLIGILDTQEKTFCYTNAGHPTPLIIRDSQVIGLESHGMLLGVMPDSEYGESTVSLNGGDTLIAFSDGISEAMNGRQSMFREDGIAAAVIPPGDRTAAQLLKAIWSRLETHIAESTHGDDRTLLVLRMPQPIESLANPEM